MAITPPEDLPTWDTTDANSTDPGAAKRATGWILNEVPSSANMNWLHQQATEWLDFLRKTMAPQIAFNNIERTASAPFGADVTAARIRYDALADRWYAGVHENTTNDGKVYDSADGEAWGSSAINDTSVVATGHVPAPVSNGTVCATAIDSTYYVSTDLTVANLASQGAVDASWLITRNMNWDETNSLWIVGGVDNIGNGEVWTAPEDFSGGFTQRFTSGAYEVMSVATNPAGVSVAVTDSTTVRWSTNGTGWSTVTPAPASGFSEVVWAPSLGLFIATEIGSGDVWTSLNGGTWTDLQASIGLPPISTILITDLFVMMVDSTNEYVYSFPGAASDPDALEYINMGFMGGGHGASYAFSVAGAAIGNSSKLIFNFGASDYLAISRFGS